MRKFIDKYRKVLLLGLCLCIALAIALGIKLFRNHLTPNFSHVDRIKYEDNKKIYLVTKDGGELLLYRNGKFVLKNVYVQDPSTGVLTKSSDYDLTKALLYDSVKIRFNSERDVQYLIDYDGDSAKDDYSRPKVTLDGNKVSINLSDLDSQTQIIYFDKSNNSFTDIESKSYQKIDLSNDNVSFIIDNYYSKDENECEEQLVEQLEPYLNQLRLDRIYSEHQQDKEDLSVPIIEDAES